MFAELLDLNRRRRGRRFKSVRPDKRAARLFKSRRFLFMTDYFWIYIYFDILRTSCYILISA